MKVAITRDVDGSVAFKLALRGEEEKVPDNGLPVVLATEDINLLARPNKHFTRTTNIRGCDDEDTDWDIRCISEVEVDKNGVVRIGAMWKSSVHLVTSTTQDAVQATVVWCDSTGPIFLQECFEQLEHDMREPNEMLREVEEIMFSSYTHAREQGARDLVGSGVDSYDAILEFYPAYVKATNRFSMNAQFSKYEKRIEKSEALKMRKARLLARERAKQKKKRERSSSGATH